MRQHLQIDAGLVHFPQPQLADIVETLDDPGRIGHVQSGDVPLHLRVEIMLLQRDDVGFRCHSPSSNVCHRPHSDDSNAASPSSAFPAKAGTHFWHGHQPPVLCQGQASPVWQNFW
jgi:hypothetical protein